MIKRTGLFKVVRPLGTAVLAMGMMAGCGDDEEMVMPDAGMADAGGGDVDAAPCQGHGCPGVDSPFQLPEGGEIRLELFQLENEADDLLAGQAFIFKDQTPESRPLEGEPLTTLEDDGIACSDFSAGNIFDNGFTPEGQTIADSRTYIDLGADVTLTASDGSEITLDKLDPGSPDGSSALQHDIIYMGGDAASVQRNTFYTAAIAGTNEFPVLELDYGEAITGEDVATPQLFFPNDFTLTQPTEADYYDAAGLSFPGDQDLTITWTEDNPVDTTAPTMLSFAAFANADGKVTSVCIKPDDGEITVPTVALDKAPAEGSLLVGRFVHMAYENVQDATRVDMLGINCKYLPSYTKQ